MPDIGMSEKYFTEEEYRAVISKALQIVLRRDEMRFAMVSAVRKVATDAGDEQNEQTTRIDANPRDLYSEAVKLIPSKSEVEKKQIALQLLGFQLDQSEDKISAGRAADVIGMLIESLSINSEEIKSLHQEIESVNGEVQKLSQINKRIIKRCKRLSQKKTWMGSIGEACEHIASRVRENEKLPASERKFPVDGLQACTAFLDEYEFYHKEKYRAKTLHEYYRKVRTK